MPATIGGVWDTSDQVWGHRPRIYEVKYVVSQMKINCYREKEHQVKG